jgi:ribosome-binding protein aMBF1 (putative translation factor)
MICTICGLGNGTKEILSKRGQEILICENCYDKIDATDENEE